MGGAKGVKGVAQGGMKHTLRTPGRRATASLVVARSHSTPLKKGEFESSVFDPTSFRTAFSGRCGGAVIISPAAGLRGRFALRLPLGSVDRLLELLHSDSVNSLSLRCIFAVRVQQQRGH